MRYVAYYSIKLRWLWVRENTTGGKNMFYITKYMIEDYLKSKNIPVKICGKEPWKFADLEIYSEDSRDHSVLYFLENNDQQNTNTRRVCIVHNVKEMEFEEYYSENEEIICCCNRNSCYVHLVSCFNFYKNWYLQLQENLIKGNNLQALVNDSVPVFMNPIAVSDVGFQVLAYTKEYHEQMDDYESKFIVKNGCHSPEYIRLITKHSNFIHNLKNNLGPFLFHYEFLQHESIYCTIWLHGKPVGFLTIVGMNEFRKKAAIDAAQIFSGILSKAFVLNSVSVTPGSPSDQLLLQYLKGRNDDSRIIYTTFSDIPGSGSDAYSCVHISMLIINPNQSMLLRKVYDSLFKKLRYSKILFDHTGITVILSCRDISPDQMAHMVGILLLSYSYQIGISHYFYGFHTLREHFRQSVVCIELNRNVVEEHVFHYETCMIQDIIRNPLSLPEKRAAIHPALHMLKEYDRKNGTVHIHTLKTYLDANCNGTVAAQTLHIHKNTLYYRLKQIEDLTDLAFRSSSVCDCLRFSFYLSEIDLA
jgi:hypothetical protein